MIVSSSTDPATERSARRGSSPGIASRSSSDQARSAACGAGAAPSPRPAGCAVPRSARRPRSDDARAPRLRIVPGRPDHAVESALGDLIEIGAHLAIEVLDQAPLVALRQRIGLHEPFRQPDHADLEALAEGHLRRGPERHLDAAAADVDRPRRSSRRCPRRSRPPGESAGLLRCRR